MLVLRRKVRQWVDIHVAGRLVRVCATRVDDDRVWLGVQADQDVLVLREEIADKVLTQGGKLYERVQRSESRAGLSEGRDHGVLG